MEIRGSWLLAGQDERRTGIPVPCTLAARPSRSYYVGRSVRRAAPLRCHPILSTSLSYPLIFIGTHHAIPDTGSSKRAPADTSYRRPKLRFRTIVDTL
jgi:hypothetical protein